MPHDRSKVLVVDDSKMFLQVLVQSLAQAIPGEIIAGSSLEETRSLLAEHDFDVAMLDLNLPDAPQGEVVDLVMERGIPVIVFAGDCTDQTRKRLWSKHIVDYVVKEGGESLRYAVSQARRVLLNREVKVLVVEDSDTVRTMVAGLLRVHRFQVFEAVNGREGLRVLAANPDIRLIITDYEMPEMDGVRFIRAVRGRHPKEEMAIIGISSHEQEFLSTRFLKSGANDFLSKPFSSEEFYCRISQNMDLLEYIQTIRDYSEKDFLTGLFNRRYLFDKGPARIRRAHKRSATLCLAMLDIDHFKKINDRFGHEAGDVVLKDLGVRLGNRFGALGIAARLGGEEFCLLLDEGVNDAAGMLDQFRDEISSTCVVCGQDEVVFSLSIGLCASETLDLESMLRKADEMLYVAKENGRNRLEVWSETKGCLHV
jgi:diguanylate cyclase (GGDEF)-like protein